MFRTQTSAILRAPVATVFEMYRDYRCWPQLFPATIAGVRPVSSEGDAVLLAVAHKRKDPVLNRLRMLHDGTKSWEERVLQAQELLAAVCDAVPVSFASRVRKALAEDSTRVHACLDWL